MKSETRSGGERRRQRGKGVEREGGRGGGLG